MGGDHLSTRGSQVAVVGDTVAILQDSVVFSLFSNLF